MNVLLVGMKRNLNRCIRTCYSFGVDNIFLLGCDESYIKGNLFSAKGKVKIQKIESIEEIGEFRKIVGFEINGSGRCEDLKNADCIAIGGEQTMLSKSDFEHLIKIPVKNNLCLTAEAALAIGLYMYETQI